MMMCNAPSQLTNVIASNPHEAIAKQSASYSVNGRRLLRSFFPRNDERFSNVDIVS